MLKKIFGVAYLIIISLFLLAFSGTLRIHDTMLSLLFVYTIIPLLAGFTFFGIFLAVKSYNTNKKKKAMAEIDERINNAILKDREERAKV